MLALRSGVSVVPVYIRGTGTALGRGQRWPRFVPLTVAFGPPLDIRREAPRKAAYEAIASQMMEAIARLQEEVTGQPARWEGRPTALHSPV
jgi:1-acyl-sn-glycerol-3-phosphate acyltransferase